MPRRHRKKIASLKLLKEVYEFIDDAEWSEGLICGEDGEEGRWERRKRRIQNDLWKIIQAHDPSFCRFGNLPLHQVDPYSWLDGKLSGAAQSAAMISFLYKFHRKQGWSSKMIYEWMTLATGKTEDALKELVKNRTKMPLPDFPDLDLQINVLHYKEALAKVEGHPEPAAFRHKKKLLTELAAALKNRG